jgi:3-hydroxyacyl-CoA dehydrogenase
VVRVKERMREQSHQTMRVDRLESAPGMGRVHRTTIGRVAILEIDNPPVNALSQETRRALWDALTRADSEPEIGAIVIAAAGRTFMTGADLTEIGQKPREPHLPDVVDRIEAASKPVVVAWHGTALGGGCEIGLAAHRRVMARDARVGLPEVRLGLVPGAGGTQRLPRLIGMPAALDLIASGRMIDALEAFAIGLCDEITDGDVREAAIGVASSLIGKMQARLSLRLVTPPQAGVWEAMVHKVRREARSRIAPLRAIELVGQTLTTPFIQGAPAERHAFLDLAASDQSRALRHLFFAERAIRKVSGLEDAEARAVASVGVVGDGQNAAGIAATLIENGIPAQLVVSSEIALQGAREKVAGLVARSIRTGRLPQAQHGEIARRIGFSADLASLGGTSFVIEAATDSPDLKSDLLARIENAVPPDIPIASITGTGALEDIAGALTHPERFLGLHFFAPVQLIRVVELVRLRRAAPGCVATTLALLKKLDKIAVPCAAGKDLIGNRILGKFRSQCEFMLEEGALPAEIDRAMESFGLALGPFAAQDLAGLDIAWSRRKKDSENRPAGTRDTPLLDALCQLGRFGQKAGRGWYRYTGNHREPDPEIEALIRAHAARAGFRPRSFTAEMIQLRVLATMANEGTRILMEGIAAHPRAIDLVMVHGFGFPSWHGGPMQAADARGLRTILALAEDGAGRDGAGYEVAPLLRDLVASGRNFATLDSA